MSIKADKWIRRMAQQHGMIDPFEAGQVRTAEGGGRMISYGTSSYGYDVRCAREFKIFTNINSTIVDPKQFDEKSFVDVSADVCIIPPNSFALAHTVEYFRIPRSVLTVCLGKCVTGDTRVVDADTGAYLPITEMRFGKSTLAWNGRRLERTKVSDFIPQGKREVFELRTRAGLKIRATANHPFLALNKWVPLSELRAGDRIAVARDIPVFGKTPIADAEASRHGRELNTHLTDGCVPQAIFMAPRPSAQLFLRSLFSGAGGSIHTETDVAIELYSPSKCLIEDVHHLLLRFGISSLIDEGTAIDGIPTRRLRICDKRQVCRFAQQIGFIPGSGRQKELEGQVPSLIVAEAQHAAAGAGQSSVYPISSSSADFYGELHVDHSDTVERIEPAGVEEVFDITVPGLHNFVANDFIVHNSTYARCFSGDTRVALVDGTSASFEEMARGHDSGQLYWGYSVEGGRIIVALLDRPRLIGRDALLEVTLDNGEIVRTTHDHLFWRRDGRKTAASELRAGDSLMPLYRKLRRGYEYLYQPINGHLYPTHRLADEWNLRHGIYAEEPGTHRHHKDFDRRNNRPINIERMLAAEHLKMHNQENYGPEFDPEEHGSAIQAALARLALDPAWRSQYSEVQAERTRRFWTEDQYADIRARVLHARRNPTEDTREAHRLATLKRFEDPSQVAQHAESMRRAWASDDGTRRLAQAAVARAINLRPEITADVVRAALDQTGSIRGAARFLACDRSVFRRFPDVIANFSGRGLRNHKVTAVRDLPGVHDVYCLTVPEAGNFALEAGVFVDNCGIIVNVTPLEPEWEGHVTLEFSNTTPLPAKIYANEGVAQMLFFESDEVCETSYADRGGKYQKQRGVTLPKA